MIRREATALAVLLAACGPVITGTDGSTTTDATTTTTSTETTSTAEPPDPSVATTLSTSADATSAPPPLDTSSSTTDACDDNTGCGIGDPCDPWLADCPDGHKCVPWANDGTQYWSSFGCFPIAEDPDAIGEPCTAEGSTISGRESCEAGAFCFHVDPETNAGVCAAMCTGTPADAYCADPSTTCAIAFGGYITLCLETCDPLLDDCDIGICAPSGDGFVCGLALGPDIAIGEPCHSTWGCASGSVCTPAEAFESCEESQCCAAFCDTSLAQPCADGLVCDPWYRDDQGPGLPPPIGVCVDA